jgi:superfamily II DNA or RNA helicase
MTISLFPDQQQTLTKVRDAFRAGHRRVLMVAPTGSGKTVKFSYVARGAADRGRRVHILCHRVELIDQIDRALRAFGIVPGIIAADAPETYGARVQVASVFTVVRRLERVPVPDLVVVDEAHHATAATTWGKILNRYPQAHVLGVTATPYRLSGEGLSDMFDCMVLGPTTQELIDLGRLSPVTVFAPSAPDLAAVHTRMGEYVHAELADVMARSTVTGSALDHYRKHAHQKPAVAFCVSVAHAGLVAEQFRNGGYSSVSIDGSLSGDIRRRIVDDFSRGLIHVLTSCDLISEGFDCPRIEVGISLRPTQSTGLWLQQTGRCLRAFPGKQRAIILDHAGNTHRHGLPTEHREWSLAGEHRDQQRRRVHPPVASARICGECFAANNSARSTCANCGAAFLVKPRKVQHVAGELEEVTVVDRRRPINPASSFNGLVKLGQMRGYKNPEGWARHVLDARKRKTRDSL